MSDLPHIIIVTGLPCAGKTTLARQIATHFSLPLLSKDMIKESLFDTLGWSDRHWSRILGQASIELLFRLLQVELSANRTCLAESNFDPVLDGPRFEQLSTICPYRAVQIYCHASSSVLIERFTQRAASGERHPGHGDAHNAAEFVASLEQQAPGSPLPLNCPIVSLDTTDLAAIDYPGLHSAIAQALAVEDHG